MQEGNEGRKMKEGKGGSQLKRGRT
jgi:hypothetical protein